MGYGVDDGARLRSVDDDGRRLVTNDIGGTLSFFAFKFEKKFSAFASSRSQIHKKNSVLIGKLSSILDLDVHHRPL